MLEKYINIGLIKSSLSASSKEEVLREVSELIVKNFDELDATNITNELSQREQIGSTGIETGIAIPHAKINGINNVIISVGRSETGINFDSNDKGPTKLFFVLLAPLGGAGEHLKVLARLAKLLTVKELKEKLLEARDEKEIYQTLIEADKRF